MNIDCESYEVLTDISLFGCHNASLGKWFLTFRKFGITYPAM